MRKYGLRKGQMWEGSDLEEKVIWSTESWESYNPHEMNGMDESVAFSSW